MKIHARRRQREKTIKIHENSRPWPREKIRRRQREKTMKIYEN